MTSSLFKGTREIGKFIYYKFYKHCLLIYPNLVCDTFLHPVNKVHVYAEPVSIALTN